MGNIYSVAQVQSWCTRRWGLEQCVCSCGGMKQVIILWKGCGRAWFNTSPHLGTLSGKCLRVFAQGIRMCQSFETLLCEDPGQMSMTVCWCGVSSIWDSFRLMAHGVPPDWGWAAAVPLLQQVPRSMARWLWYSSRDGHCTAHLTGQPGPVSVTLRRNWWAVLERSWELLLCNVSYQCFLCQFLDAVGERVLWSFFCAELQSLSISESGSKLAGSSWN